MVSWRYISVHECTFPRPPIRQRQIRPSRGRRRSPRRPRPLRRQFLASRTAPSRVPALAACARAHRIRRRRGGARDAGRARGRHRRRARAGRREAARRNPPTSSARTAQPHGSAAAARRWPIDTVRFVGEAVAAVVARDARAGARRGRGDRRRLRGAAGGGRRSSDAVARQARRSCGRTRPATSPPRCGTATPSGDRRVRERGARGHARPRQPARRARADRAARGARRATTRRAAASRCGCRSQTPTGVRDELVPRVLGIDAGEGARGRRRRRRRLRHEDRRCIREDVVAACARAAAEAPGASGTADRIEEFLVGDARPRRRQPRRARARRRRQDAARCACTRSPTSAPTRRRPGVVIQLLIGPWVSTSIYDIPTIDLQHRGRAHQHDADRRVSRRRPARGDLHHRAADGRGGAQDRASIRVELRRRNMIRPEQMPYTNPMGKTYDSGQLRAGPRPGARAAPTGTASTRGARESKAARQAARPRHRHLPRMDRRRRVRGAGRRSPSRPTAAIEIFSATQAMGQGIATSFAQLAVDVFGVPIEKIRIVQGDTDRGTGFGSAGSRSLFVGGSAVQVASERTVEKAQELAAEALEAARRRHRVPRRRVPHRRHRSRASACSSSRGKQADERIVLDSTSTVAGPTWPNGCHVCEVEIDPDTGDVEVVGYCVGQRRRPRGQPDDRRRASSRAARCRASARRCASSSSTTRESGQPLTGELHGLRAAARDTIATTSR